MLQDSNMRSAGQWKVRMDTNAATAILHSECTRLTAESLYSVCYTHCMKTIAVFFDNEEDDGYPLNEEYYRIAYYELAETIEKKGGRLIVVRGQSSYIGGNVFEHYWDITPDAFSRMNERVTPELIYNKGNFHGDPNAHVINDPELDAICLDKRKTVTLFPKQSPLTLEVSNREQANAAITKLGTTFAVAKPIDGKEGVGVFIGPKMEVAASIPHYPYLLQEFIDTSGGIPGITDGLHDLRMIHVNEEIVLAFIRIPAAGKFISNLAQGGTKQELRLEQLPKEALEISKEVEGELARFGTRVYSIDIGRDRSGVWKIIELNSQPGVTCRSEGPLSIYYQTRLAETLLSS